MLNNAPDGNLTSGWFKPDQVAPHAPSGGPSIRFANGHYYVITGGRTVELYRSPDLKNWTASPHNPMIHPTPADAKVAPYAGFPDSWQRKGFGPNMDNWQAWDWNSNDGDVCCMSPNSTTSWLVWGASTQGQHPRPPVQHGCTNAVGSAPMPLAELLGKYFEP